MNPDLDSNDPVMSPDRLSEIARFDLYGDEIRASLSRLAQNGAEALGLPIGLVSIVLDSAQYFAGMHGLDGWLAEAEGTPVEWAFCANAVRRAETYVVTNATTDELQHDNPLVVADGVRSYAGAPLITTAGHALGAYCVIGTEPRDFSDADLELLNDLARQVIAELEAHQL